jgi:AICAR transformylase/IMP cyclohydrolase PurH
MCQALSEVFTEVVIAPRYEEGALELLSKKYRSNLTAHFGQIRGWATRPGLGGGF